LEEKEIIKDNEAEEGEMTFLDHLEELRWRLIYILIGAVVGVILCWVVIDYLVAILLKPALDYNLHLQNLKPFGQLMIYMQIAIMGGLILSLPNVFYQLWKFIAPALRKNERKYALSIVAFTTACFLIGIAFAYFVMLPLTLQFAAQFGSNSIENNFAIDEYFSIVFSVMLGAGLVFELPMVSFFLSKLGILKPQFMRKYRKHAIVVIMIAAAFLSPGTDPVSQIVLTIPLVLLYEISIFISKISQKKA
jgi:sec-independent protein translocase protein TatC